MFRPLSSLRVYAIISALLVSVSAIAGMPGRAIAASSGILIVSGSGSDSHVSGDLVTFTSIDASTGELTIGHYDLATGAAGVVPAPAGSFGDFLSDVFGTRVVFTRVTSTKSAIYTFDVASPAPPAEVAPLTSGTTNRRQPSIGGQTVAWADIGLHSRGEIVVHDLVSGTTTRLTNDAEFDQGPDVAPDGNTIVWRTCTATGACNVWRASRTLTGWSSAQMTTSGKTSFPSTDGLRIAYAEDLGSGFDIAVQPVAGGAVTRLVRADTQTQPRISGDLVAFTELTATGRFVHVWHPASGAVRRLTATTGRVEFLPDLTRGADGAYRATWSVSTPEGSSGVEAMTFRWSGGQIVPTGWSTTVLLPYLDQGWLYKQVATGAEAGFEAPAYDTSTFSTGPAAFGSIGGCPLNDTANVKTSWSLNTDLLLRKTFNLPAGARRVKVHVAIDNDVQVFVNGTDVSGGLRVHEGCAARPTWIFDVPATALLSGSNLVALRARDRGVESFVDVQITAEVRLTPTFSDLIADVSALGLGNGLTNSLVVKLQNAQASGAAGNLKAMCNQLDAFINEVNAKTPNPISATDAAALIASAQAIKADRGCP